MVNKYYRERKKEEWETSPWVPPILNFMLPHLTSRRFSCTSYQEFCVDSIFSLKNKNNISQIKNK